MPVLDSAGFPNGSRGTTDYPGLFFVGLPWLHNYKSGHIFGVGDDAKYIASIITNGNGISQGAA
jgi:putative flavoprotein involved in K+ transport